ncbi:ABC transporter permease [Nocardia harenae]|uniref:ABC transporter permease n=1 Tax=Nocardia harenae TaxID=358707 RepID=UPI00082D8923|nr:ABC transporter permease [Nocardia harenae]
MTLLIDAVRSEFAKLSRRSPLWYTVLPLAVLIPTALNFGIAKAVESNQLNGGGGMDTDNAAYWILVFSTFILMVGAVSALAGEFRDDTAQIVFRIQPRRWLLPVAKLVVYGLIGAVTAAFTVLVMLGGFPLLFPEIWGRVEILSADGIRLWLGIPLFTVLVCALGLGLAALLPKPGLVVMIVLLWKFGVETFVTFVPGDLGITLQQLSPFRNGELGVGQMATFDSAFGGQNGSLLYFAAICVAIFAAGTVRLTRADVRNDQ